MTRHNKNTFSENTERSNKLTATKGKKKLGQIILNLVFLLISITYLMPLILVLSISLTDEKSVITDGYSLIPKVFSTAAYELAFRNPQQLIASYQITILFTIVSTFLAVLIMGVMAYPLSRPNFKLKGPITFFVFFTMLFSGGMVPSYLLNVKYLHLDNTFWVYILPGLVSAWNLIIIRTNYKGLPNELMEAAKIDGASEVYICFKIVMPLSKPVLASIGFLFLVAKWNDWQTSMLYITNPKLMSLQYMLQRILMETQFLKQLVQSGQIMEQTTFPSESFRYAMALLAAGPVMLIFPFFQKYFAKGLTLGAVKG